MGANIYPSVIFINDKRVTTAFIHDLLIYNCNFKLEGIEVKSANKVKHDIFDIKYPEINNISLSLCSRIGSSGTIGHTITPCLVYHIDIIVNTKDDLSYVFEVEPTLKILDLIKYIKNLNIDLLDKFKIEELLVNVDNISIFNDYMANNFENLAKEYNLDNPRKKY